MIFGFGSDSVAEAEKVFRVKNAEGKQRGGVKSSSQVNQEHRASGALRLDCLS